MNNFRNRQHRYKMNVNRRYHSYRSIKTNWGKNFESAEKRKEHDDLLDRDKKIFNLLDIQSDYDIMRVMAKLFNERWSLYDLLRLLIEGYLIDDRRLINYIYRVREDGDLYPSRYRMLDKKDDEIREEMRKMFDCEYLSKERDEEIYDFMIDHDN
jgi:hypothetical protein